jgi:hypothetical protein
MPTRAGKEKNILCYAPCHDCGANCEYRLESTGRVYYLCDGNYDTRACGFRARLGATRSENLKREIAEKIAKAEQETNDDAEAAAETHAAAARAAEGPGAAPAPAATAPSAAEPPAVAAIKPANGSERPRNKFLLTKRRSS